MYVKDAAKEAASLQRELCKTLLTIAKKNTHTIMPGYTHLQRAQPITIT